MDVIRYQELREGTGFAIEEDGRRVALYADHARVAERALGSARSLDQLISGYRILREFPHQDFSLSDPFTGRRLVIRFDHRLARADEIAGEIIEADSGEIYPWIAAKVASPVFADRTNLRSWLSPGIAPRAEAGWAYRVPGQLTGDDPVYAARIRGAIQTFVLAIEDPDSSSLPADWSLGNVFSLTNPPPPPTLAPDMDAIDLPGDTDFVGVPALVSTPS